MDRFLTQDGLNWISVALVVAAFILALWFWIDGRMRLHDEEWALANPPRFDVKPDHAAHLVEGMREPSLFSSMDCLTRPLKDYRNPTPPGDSMDELLANHGVSAADRADLVRGTKL